MEPKIRFKGYMFGWVSEAIGLYYNFKNGLNKSKEYFGFGTPIVNFTDVFNNRVLDYASLKGRVFVTKEEIANYSVQKGDLFFTRTSETLEEIGYPSVMLSDSPQTVYSGFVLRGRAINNDPLVDVFKSYVFFTTSFRKEMIRKSSMTTRALTSGNRLKEMIFTYPKAEDEQFKIGNYFRTLDSKIQTTSKKLASLKKLKSASLVAMFPQNGESMPKVRFKGFEGEWKETTLSECLDISYLQNSENKYDKNDVLSVSDDFGVMNQIELLGRSYAGKDVSSYSILQKGEIVYTKSPLKDKPFGIIKKNSYQTGIVSILYAVYHSKDNISADYIHYYFDPAWRLNAYMRPLVNKGAKNTMNISDEMALMGSLIIPPSLAEQQAIASYFITLDRKIALETARLEKLKQIKLACLDKMFV